jgi:hypothetical protein
MSGQDARLFILVCSYVCGVELTLLMAASADQTSQARFTLMCDGAAVKDNQSGLMWSKVPTSSTMC